MSTIPLNPYIVGNPIKSRAMFFGREDDFAFIQKKIGDGRSNQIVVLCGERRSGKTSILFQILGGRLGASFLPVLIDMQMLAGVGGEREFFAAILRAGYSSPALAALPAGQPAPSAAAAGAPAALLDPFLDDVERLCPGRIVLFLFDEYELIEAKIRDATLTESVIHSFAGLLEGRRRISFIFTGSTNLEDREGHVWTALLGKSMYRKISYLSRRDTERLIVEPLGDVVSWPQGVTEGIVRLTGGQPFYTQVICQNMVDLLIEEDRCNPSVEDLERIVREIVDNPLPQMIYSWNAIPRDGQVVMAALAGRLAQPEEYATPADVIGFLAESRIRFPFPRERINVLLETGYHNESLEKEGDNRFRFRMDVFRRWIRREHSIWKVAREAGLAFRGRRRAGLIAGIAAAVVLALAAAALLLPGPRFLAEARTRVFGGQKAAATPAVLEKIVFRASRGPFRLSVDGQPAYTSDGQPDVTSITVPTLTAGRHRYHATPATGAPVESNFDVVGSGTVIQVVFAPAATSPARPSAPASTAAAALPAQEHAPAAQGAEEAAPPAAEAQPAAPATAAGPPAASEAEKPGTLVLTSRPPDARVFVNGVDTGRTTPFTQSMTPGTYEVRLEHSGYRTSTTTVTIAGSEEPLKTDITMERAMAWLSLDVRPTAKVTLDNVFLVETPIARPVAIPAGQHVLLIENEDLGVKKEIHFEVAEGETWSVKEILK